MQIRPGNNMVSRRNHLLFHFSITIQYFTSNLAGFYAQNTLKKISHGKC